MTDRIHEGIHKFLENYLSLMMVISEHGLFGQGANTPSSPTQSAIIAYIKNFFLIQGYLLTHLFTMLLFWFCQIVYNDGKLMIVFWD
jgi:hypothetical protein